MGVGAGENSTSGILNSFFGIQSGRANTTGSRNAFFGASAGSDNTTGLSNAFFGASAGKSSGAGSYNSFFGDEAGTNGSSSFNSFFGYRAGYSNSAGEQNAFFGYQAGRSNTTGAFNTFVGYNAGLSNTTGSSNIYIGAGADGVPGLNNAAAIGANAQVTTSNTMVLGTDSVTVRVPGQINVSGSANAASYTGDGSGLTNVNAATLGGQPASAFGDITSVSAGTGLSGGGASGAATLSLDTAFTDTRYAAAAHGHNVTEITNAATLGANSFGGSQSVAGNVSATGTVSGASGSFQTNVTVGDPSTGGGITLTNTVNRFAELGSNVGFDSVAGAVVGLRLKSTHPLENYSYGIFHGSNVFPGALVFRKDDESISPGDARNRLIIAGNGDVIVNSGNLGIGTTAPTSRLHVEGSDSPVLQVKTTATSGGQQRAQIDLKDGFNNGWRYRFAGDGDDNLDFSYISSNNVGSPTLTLGHNGNIGVGTTAPQTKLHVQGGDILVGSPGQGIILKSPSGTICRLLTIDDNGAMVLNTIACP